MIKLERNGYTEKEIKSVLHGAHGTRSVRFRYDLLDKNNVFKAEMFNVLAGSIDYGVFNEIRRTAKFTIKEQAAFNAAFHVDYMSDRIRPVMVLEMPAMVRLNKDNVREVVPKGEIEFPLGIFMLSSPTRSHNEGAVDREIEAYDLSKILTDDVVDDMYTVRTGTTYKQALIDLLTSAGISTYNIEDTTKVVPIDMQWETGTPKIKIANDICASINFIPIVVDVNGVFTSYTYLVPQVRPVDYTYEDNDLSVIMKGVSEELDTYNIPNKWIVVRTNSEEEPLRSVYVNSNPDSITSTVRRGRTIVDYREIENIADQAALDAYAKRIADESSQIYGKSKFNTALMPMHDYHDVIQLKYSKLGIDDKFTETAWSMDLTAGGTMTHEVRRVVQL